MPRNSRFTETEFRKAFFDKVEITDGCWIWLGCRNSHGYGHVSFNGTNHHAHRISWLLHFGKIPEHISVLHHCDNRPCVRPDHLFLGTTKDNMQDCAKKGRLKPHDIRGIKNPLSKFTESQIEFIRTIFAEGFTRRRIANYFGVKWSTIDNIVNRKSWNHVP